MISDKVRALCTKHWSAKREGRKIINKCPACPLYAACIKTKYKSVQERAEGLNAAAEGVEL